MRLEILCRVLALLCTAVVSSSSTAWAMDEAVLTPTSKTAVAQEDKEFNDAMSIWFKHRYKDGAKLLREFSEQNPNSRWAAEADLHVGCYLTYLNRLDEARTIFDKVIEKHPNHIVATKAKIRLGNVAERGGRFGEAIDYYCNALKMNPSWDQFRYANYRARKLIMTQGKLQARINCGPVALAACLDSLGKQSEAADARNLQVGVDGTDGVQTDYTYDAANKMVGPGVFTYDDAGNPLTRITVGSQVAYTWDYRNQLVRYQCDQTDIELTYDGHGNRVGKLVNGVSTEFVLDGREVVEAIEGTLVTSYIGTSAKTIGSIVDTGHSVYHCDRIGSIRVATDGSETITEVGIYDAYGVETVVVGSSPPFGYAGQHRYYTDTSALQHLKARYYDPSVGRFISKDPVKYGRNHYVYAMNCPTMMVDPLGLWPTGCILGAIGGGGASLIGGGNWKEALCNAAMGCAIGELTEYIIQAFPETGATLAKCAVGAIAGGVAGQAGSGICGALFGDCPKDPLDWRCMAQSGFVGAVIGCAGGLVDDGILGAVLGIVGESLGLAVGSGCSNDIW